MLSQARVLLAMARDGLLPASFFGAVHEKYRTPWKSTIVTGGFVALLSSIYRDLGFAEFQVKFSDRPPVRAGDDATWDRAEAALKPRRE